MSIIRGVCVAAFAVVLTACASKGEDYFGAQDLPPLVFPAGQETRQVKPLFPIPPATAATPAEWPKKFEVPRPRPLAEGADMPAANAPAQPSGSERPELSLDGNGYSVLTIRGDFNAIWDNLEQALKAAGVKVEDRDQGIGQYYLSLADTDGKKATYQLRVTRGQSAYTLTLQKDDDTLASQEMTRTLFESIVARWPGDKP